MRIPCVTRTTRLAVAAGFVAALVLAPAALGGDRELLRAKERFLPAAQRAYGGDPDGLQARYDAGRDLVEAVHAAGPVSCTALQGQLLALGEAQVAIAEAEDYPVRRTAPPVPRVTASCRPGAPFRTSVTRTSPKPVARWVARGPSRADAGLAARLAAATRSFRGYAAAWVHDLRTGRYAGANPDLRVPGASTVKLAPLLAAIRHGGEPLRYDAEQIGAWSSNLAANRVVQRLGLPTIAESLRRLGMTSSTYPGLYRAGTARRAGPPGHHTRVTTVRDLGRALYRLHAGAQGDRRVLRLLGVSRRQASAAVASLLGALPVGENRGLLAPSLRATPLAQKNGWISDTRLTAAIVYGKRGPAIVVVAGYDEGGVSEAEGIALGRRVLSAARLR